jgi:hypothetical protein
LSRVVETNFFLARDTPLINGASRPRTLINAFRPFPFIFQPTRPTIDTLDPRFLPTFLTHHLLPWYFSSFQRRKDRTEQENRIISLVVLFPSLPLLLAL